MFQIKHIFNTHCKNLDDRSSIFILLHIMPNKSFHFKLGILNASEILSQQPSRGKDEEVCFFATAGE